MQCALPSVWYTVAYHVSEPVHRGCIADLGSHVALAGLGLATQLVIILNF